MTIFKLIYRCKNCRAQTCVSVHVKPKHVQDWQDVALNIANNVFTDILEDDIQFSAKFHCCDDIDSEFGVNELIRILKK